MVALVGWRYAFAFLAIGPALGFLAMARLRAYPDALSPPAGGGEGGYSTPRASTRASMASQIRASSDTPSKRPISWMPVGEVTLISVR